MNILMSCDDRIAKYVPALQASLYANHPNVKINIFLMHSKVSKQVVEVLKKFALDKGHTFTDIIPQSEDFEIFKKVDPKRLDAFPVEAYYHFLAHKYLPSEVNRCLYLDIDTICCGNFYDWYQTDFADHFYISAHRYLKDDYRCFNTGVFIINLEKFRNENIDKSFYERKIENCVENNITLFGDQEFLGFAFKDYKNNGFLFTHKVGINFRIYNDRDLSLGLTSLNEKMYIIHYATSFKAWRYYLDETILNQYIGHYSNSTDFEFSVVTENILKLYGLFWKYAKNAPFYNMIYAEAVVATKEMRLRAEHHVISKKRELFLNSIAIRDNYSGEDFVIPQPSYNNHNFAVTTTSDYIEFKVLHYIFEQWIVFPLSRPLKKGETLSLSIKCEYETDRPIYLFLSDYNMAAQHLPKIDSNTYTGEITANRDYAFLCLSSNSFPTKGNFIKIFAGSTRLWFEN
jgi:lipopolysaccharide biosynthesis glycosyltransferase